MGTKLKKLFCALTALTLVPITVGIIPNAEANAPVYINDLPAPVYALDFDGNDASVPVLNEVQTSYSTEQNSQVLSVNGRGYLELPALTDEAGNPEESFTVSFDLKNSTEGNYFNFYIGDGGQNDFGYRYLAVKAAETLLISTVDDTLEKKIYYETPKTQNRWRHYDIIVSNGCTTVLADGVFAGSLIGYRMRDIKSAVIRLGFSPWTADHTASAEYDNFRVYRGALNPQSLSDMPGIDVSDPSHILFAMDFNSGTPEPSIGSVRVNGTVLMETAEGSPAAHFDGNPGNYLELFGSDGKNLLAGRDEFMVSFRTKADTPSWWFYAAPNKNNQSGGAERYIGLLDSGQSVTAERYFSDGYRVACPYGTYSPGTWKDIKIAVGKHMTTLFINGKAVACEPHEKLPSQILGDNPSVFVGRANWGQHGEGAAGLIDDFVIYDFAPAIDLGEISQVLENLSLPNPDSVQQGYSIRWNSSDPSLMEANGVIHPPKSGLHNIELTAEIQFGQTSLTQSFTMGIPAAEYCDLSVDITADKGVDIQPNLFGLFFEDINYAADGGLYAEMIENRSFEAEYHSPDNPAGYYDGGYGWFTDGGTLTMKSAFPLNSKNPHYGEFTADISSGFLYNKAYDGVYMEAGKTYNVSFYARTAGYDGSIQAVLKKDGRSICQTQAQATEARSDGWTKYTAVLAPSQTIRHGQFGLSLTHPGTVCFDMISVMPADAVYNLFRSDLVQKLKDLNPGFLRFPGGCVIEGFNLDNRYNWKDSVGAVEERPENWSRWALHTNGFEHYNQTYGLGFYEYFLLCEYLGADPVPVVNCGMACQFQTNETVPLDSAEFQQYIKDAIDLLEFANGDVTSQWGALRAQMGHPEPFNLKYLGIGNEQFQTQHNQFRERYEAFEQAIHSIPQYRDIQLISTSGTGVEDDAYYSAWSWIRERHAQNPDFCAVVDEHYYRSADWFFSKDTFYDSYPRDVKVFAGEYASNTNGVNIFKNALAEAAYLTGVERNADVVYMASYAPMFARIGYTQWSPDMIWFDDVSSYGSPSYYVQKLYSNHTGDYTLKSTLKEQSGQKFYQSASYDSETDEIIIKLVNPYEIAQTAHITLDSRFVLTGSASVQTLSGNQYDLNSVNAPERIAPVTDTTAVSPSFRHLLPASSFVVIRIPTVPASWEISCTQVQNGILTINAQVSGQMEGKELIIALYDKNGELSKVYRSESSDTRLQIPAEGDTHYQIKTAFGKKGTLIPPQQYGGNFTHDI